MTATTFDMTRPTLSDEGFRKSLIVSGALHLIGLLFLVLGLPHLMPPLPEHHVPVPLTIVEIADLTNTRLKEPDQPKPPEPPPPPKPQTKPEQVQPQAQTKPPEPDVEGLKKAPPTKPKPPEPKHQEADLTKLLKNLEVKKPETPKAAETQPDSKSTAQPVSQAPTLSTRLTISEEDALRRQISQCWNIPMGARNAQELVVQVSIDVNPDRTVQHAEIVDKTRMATDSFFRAAAESALRALYSPQCTPLELPPDKYQQWKHIDFTFDPRDML